MANIAAPADIAGFILQYCAESRCTQFIFSNRISPRTTLHFSDLCTHKCNQDFVSNETCQYNSHQPASQSSEYFELLSYSLDRECPYSTKTQEILILPLFRWIQASTLTLFITSSYYQPHFVSVFIASSPPLSSRPATRYKSICTCFGPQEPEGE